MSNPLYQLHIRARMLIIMVTFLIPVLILGSELNSTLQNSIDASLQDGERMQIVPPLVKLLDLVSNHQLAMMEKQAGEPSADRDAAIAMSEIERTLAQLTQFDEAQDKNPGMTPENLKKHGPANSLNISDLKKKWDTLKNNPVYSAPPYKSLESDVTALIAQAENASGPAAGEDAAQEVANAKQRRTAVMGLSAACVLAAFVIFFIISNSIIKPIKSITGAMKTLAKGDTGVAIPSLENKDEIGEMAKALLVFKDTMVRTESLHQETEMQKADSEREKHLSMNKMADEFESSVKTVVTEVSASAEEMRSNAERLNVLAGETKSTSGIVASSATEAAQTANQVAAAAEELTAAIGEISAQVQKSSGVANQASAQAENINQSMHLLVEKSNRVGEVIQFITNIASQINLLALNATIESARAGEAGRGFAVVASEVKNLANQTAKATEEIVQQVQSMQDATKDAVHSVGSIITIIGEISASTAGVAAAVEEQSAATNEISRNIAHTANGTSEISRSIVSVEKGADETGVSSRHVLDSAQALSTQSGLLSEKVEQFLDMIRNMQ